MHVFFRRSAPFLGALALTLALIAPLVALAQDDPDPDSAAPAGIGVARISLIEGSVAVQRGDSNDSLAAAQNAPVLGGDYVTTGDGARAEIQVDGYSQVRVGQDVQMRFTRLDANTRSLQLAAGTIELRLMRGVGSVATVVDTPSITIKPHQAGSYRITVTADGQTLVTVRLGDAEIDTPQNQQDLQPGSTLVAQGEATDPTLQTQAAVALDDFDRFNAERDRDLAGALADAPYVNPQIDGINDLAADGRWVDDASYGNVWVPDDVGPDWAPYRDGRWVWEESYGWTWIASEPWGWAPYHYGSWYNSPVYGWCWYPPQPAVIAPWRPAMVAFIGLGGGSGFSLGFGGGFGFGQIGWVPLAPFEPYHPWWGSGYGYGYGYGRRFVTNVTNVSLNVTVYKNVQYNAVTSVSSEHFLQGNFTHNDAVAPAQLSAARVFSGAVPVVPTASNLRFSNAPAAPAVSVSAGLMQRSFAGSATVVQRTPFTAQRVAFASVTHATITPLHFRDAQTTPIVAARPLESTTRAAGLWAQPSAASATRAPGAAASDNAWSRFNTIRTSESASARTPLSEPAAHPPVTVDDRTQSSSTIDRFAPRASDVRSPAATQTYHGATAARAAAGSDNAGDVPRSYRASHPRTGQTNGARVSSAAHDVNAKVSPHPSGTGGPVQH